MTTITKDFVRANYIDIQARDAPEPIGSVPKLAVDQVTVQVHRHRRGRMPQHPLNNLGIGAGAQP